MHNGANLGLKKPIRHNKMNLCTFSAPINRVIAVLHSIFFCLKVTLFLLGWYDSIAIKCRFSVTSLKKYVDQDLFRLLCLLDIHWEVYFDETSGRSSIKFTLWEGWFYQLQVRFDWRNRSLRLRRLKCTALSHLSFILCCSLIILRKGLISGLDLSLFMLISC